MEYLRVDNFDARTYGMSIQPKKALLLEILAGIFCVLYVRQPDAFSAFKK